MKYVSDSINTNVQTHTHTHADYMLTTITTHPRFRGCLMMYTKLLPIWCEFTRYMDKQRSEQECTRIGFN